MNKKVSTLLTLSLILGGSLLSSSAFAEAFPLGSEPLKSVANGDEVVFFQKGTNERVLGINVNADNTKELTYVAKDADFDKDKVANYKWKVLVGQTTTKNPVYSFVNVATGDTLAFNDSDEPLFTNKAAKIYATDGKYQFYYTVNRAKYDGTDSHRFFSATDLDNTTSSANKAIYLGASGSVKLNSNSSEYQNVTTYLYDTTPDAVDDTELNEFFNTKGFNLDVKGTDVQGNLFGGDSRIWAFEVESADGKGYKISTDKANGKDLYIPDGIYFFTERVMSDSYDSTEKTIKAEDIDWLESTFIAVSVKETVENTVPDRSNGQGFKLVSVKGSDFIFVDNTSEVAVGDMPINNACFNVYDNYAANADYPYALELGTFYYQAKSTDKDTDKAASAKVQLGVLPFDNESVQWLTTISKTTTAHQYAFRFGDSAAVDGIDLLKTTKEAAVYTIKFVAGNEEDEELIGKYLTVGNSGSSFEWIAKGSMIANPSHPAYQYTITAVDDETGKLITFTNRETNESFTAQLFPEEGTNRYSIAAVDSKGKATELEVMPLDVNLNSYEVDEAVDKEIPIDEDVVIELTPVTPDEYAGFLNVDNESVRTIRFARDKYDTSYKWYAGVLNTSKTGIKYSLVDSGDDYFVEDVYDAAQWQLIKAEKPETIARTFVYNNTTTESIDDVPNGDKVSAYQYVLRYINDGTPTEWYLSEESDAVKMEESKSDQFAAYDKKKDFDALDGIQTYYIKENADGSVSLFNTTSSFVANAKRVTTPNKKVSLDADINTKGEVYYQEGTNRPDVYAYVSKAMNLKTYLDGEAPVYSWPGEEGHVTLKNSTAISGDYITVNENNEGILVNEASESFYLHVTDKNAVVPSFYISLGKGEGSNALSERNFLFNPVDSVAYPVNMDYDPNYQLSKADTKAIFKAATMDASRDTLTTTIKGEVRPVAEVADNDNTWGGLNRFKFQIIETADGDALYNIRQTAGSVNADGTPGSETVYLASSGQKLYFTTEKAYALAVDIESVAAPTANEAISATDVKVIALDGAVNVKNAAGKNVVVSTILGQIVANEVLTSDNATISVPAGIAIVSVDGEEAVKVSVK